MSINLGQPLNLGQKPEAMPSAAEVIGAVTGSNQGGEAGKESIVGDAGALAPPAQPKPPSAEIPQVTDVLYTCHPMERYNIGSKWRFERSQLKLTPEQSEELDRYLANPKTDARTKNLIKKIDASAAERVILGHMGRARRGVVESTDALNQRGQEVGTIAVEVEVNT